MTADTLIRGLGARRHGSTWMAKCPAHPDNNPSLSITEKNGSVLVHCHAGCSQRDVIDALKHKGLWTSEPAPRIEKRQKLSPVTIAYDYHDERGQLLYQITRHEPMPGEPKPFRQRYPDGRGDWIWKKHPRQVLYHLPEVLESPVVFIVEGEKDADTLRSHGFAATTSAGGAKAEWLPSFTGALRGRECILIPDNDQPGRLRVLRIARALLGNAARIIVMDLDGGKDVTDWFEAGHSELELIDRVEGKVRQ